MSNEYMLSEKEREVLITIAEEGPKSGYDFHLGGQNRHNPFEEGRKREKMLSSSTWEKIKERLGPTGLNLIEPVESNGDHLRRKIEYRLTIGGYFRAIFEGADVQKIRNQMEVSPPAWWSKNKRDTGLFFQNFVDFISTLNKEIKDPSYRAIVPIVYDKIRCRDKEFLQFVKFLVLALLLLNNVSVKDAIRFFEAIMKTL